MWDLSSPARNSTCNPFIGRQRLNHWITKEVPHIYFGLKLAWVPSTLFNPLGPILWKPPPQRTQCSARVWLRKPWWWSKQDEIKKHVTRWQGQGLDPQPKRNPSTSECHPSQSPMESFQSGVFCFSFSLIGLHFTATCLPDSTLRLVTPF